MAKATPKSVKDKSDKLHRQYTAHFANQARHDRDLARLEGIVSKAKGLFAKAKKLRGEPGAQVLELTKGRLKLYLQERDKIAEAQMMSPAALEAQAIGGRAKRLMGQFQRYFSGQARTTRDSGMLDDLIATLQGHRRQAAELLEQERSLDITAALNAIDTQLTTLKDEAQAIAEAKAALDLDATSRSLAVQANQHIQRFKEQVAGLPRPTVRPVLLAQILDGLEALATQMDDPIFEELADRTQHDKNATAVRKQVAAFAPEREALAEAWTQAPVGGRANLLAASANAAFDAYRTRYAGKSRLEVSLAHLRQLAERLFEIEVQLDAILTDVGDGPSPEHTTKGGMKKNLSAVRQQLGLFESEFIEVAKAQHQQRQQQGQRKADPLAGLLKVGEEA